jgi:hypothetical protein
MATLAQSTEELHLERIELAATREQRTDMEDRFHAAEEDQSVRRQALEFQVSQVMKERAQPAPTPLVLNPCHCPCSSTHKPLANPSHA